MKLYLAGPMRGHPNFNREAFRAAAAMLRAEGHEVFCPAESTEAIYGADVYANNPTGDEARTAISARRVYAADLAYICNEAEGVAFLPGWRKSKGALGEFHAAVALDLHLRELSPVADEYRTLRAANQARTREWDPSGLVTLSFRGNELAGETGEACNVIKKLERERMNMPGSRATRDQLAEELADVVICADLTAMDAGIDLDSAVRAKFNATSEKVGMKTRLVG